MGKVINKYGFFIAITLLTIAYLFFPSHNLSMDSLNYGSAVKYGETLFEPHHLLYSYFNYLLYSFLNYITPFSIDALMFMQFLNGVFALLCLLLFHGIMQKLTGDRQKAHVWTFFIGCSFGVMRFAVEAETYIIPIFFSLLSSRFYLNYLNTLKSKNVLLAGLFASIACLFHQVQLLWGIGLFFGFLRTRKIKNILYFLLPALSVLVVYSFVLVFYENTSFSFENLIKYSLSYYYSNDSDTNIGRVNFLMTPISFFRTFFQVHGNLIDLLHIMPFLYISIFLTLAFLVLSFYHFKKSVKFFKRGKFWKYDFQSTHLLIFVFQLAFAFFSHGNAEFMVMLPFLIPFFLYLFLDFKLKPVVYFSLAMFIWNFCFAVFPNHHFDYQNNKELITFIKENPDKVFVLNEGDNVFCRYYYEFGVNEYDRIANSYDMDKIRNFANEHKIIYTDVLTKKSSFNRASIALSFDKPDFVPVRHIKHIDAVMGGFDIDEVVLK